MGPSGEGRAEPVAGVVSRWNPEDPAHRVPVAQESHWPSGLFSETGMKVDSEAGMKRGF